MYDIKSGPLSRKSQVLTYWHSGNCRRAVQYYYYKKWKLFLSRRESLYPDLFWKTGTFVNAVGKEFIFDRLVPHDLIFGERIREQAAERLEEPTVGHLRTDEALLSLHTAVYTGIPGREIWHSTKISGGSCYWSMRKFLRHYRPVAAKRIQRGNRIGGASPH